MFPKTAWKFKAWTDAMLRNATVDTPDYGKKGSKSTSTGKTVRRRRRRRRKKKKDA